MKNNIVFIVQQLSQPRCIKRIETIKNGGFPVKVYGFDNGLYRENLKKLSFEIFQIFPYDKSVGKIGKIFHLMSVIRRVLRDNRKGAVFYFFGYEIACIAWLLGCRNFIYEEADVSASRIKNVFVRTFLLFLDRKIIGSSLLTIFTSEGFYEYIFGNVRHKPSNIIFLPNKLNQYFGIEEKSKVKGSIIDSSHIRFGFVGLIRYPDTIIRFARVIGRYFPQHEFHFYGDTERKEYLDDEIKSYHNIIFHGSFRNPVDLPKIYDSIDISVVCYDTKSGNVRIAEPNKLYESIFFETPIVVSSGTFLARRVKQLNVGEDIVADNDEAIIEFVSSIDAERWNIIARSLSDINYRTLVDSPQEMLGAIRHIMQ